MPDPLTTLLRLRRLAVDQARRELSVLVDAETAAAAAVREIEDAIDRETEAACRLSGDDRSVEDFAAWLRRIRAELHAASLAHQLAETRAEEARAVLAAGRAAVRATEALIEQREAEKAQIAQRQEQNALDEAACPRPGADG